VETDVATGAAQAAPGEPEPFAHRADGIVALVVVMALLLAAGLLLDSVTASSRPERGEPVAPTATPPPGATDDFQRADARGLGTAPSGEQWTAASGGWGIDAGRAAVLRAASGVSLATIPVGASNGRVSVTADAMAPGFGLAFRCRGVRNCWRVEAVPQLGTWNVVKVVDGREQLVGNLGTVPVASGTTIAVEMHGTRLEFFVDDRSARAFDDEDLALDTKAGLTLRESAGAPTARWADFAMEPAAQPGVFDDADAPIRDRFDRENADSLGTADSGEEWRELSGTWAVDDGDAMLTEPEEGAASLAILDVDARDAEIQMSMMVPQSGAGIAFRCRDADNCWRTEAVLGYATWNVYKTIRGESILVGNLGVVPTEPGTTITVRLRGDRVTFFVNGMRVRTFDDPDLAGETGAGLASIASEFADQSRWSEFLARPLESTS
jgi:hypothetical protein